MREDQLKAQVLIEALPYIHEFAGQVVVIKGGGEIVDDLQSAQSFARDVLLLHSIGVRVVLVHGGGPQISKAMNLAGKTPQFLDGLRVTDAEAIEITASVLLGEINRKLVGLLNEFSTKAVGLSGLDGRTIEASLKSEALGFVGDITQINTALVDGLLDDGYIPVIASLGIGGLGQTLNINADEAAGAMAAALGASKYILLTNVEGLFETFADKDSLISQTNIDGLAAMLDSGKLSAGMIPKIQSIVAALRSGRVGRAHILDGRVRHAVLLEIFTPEGIGTMVLT